MTIPPFVTTPSSPCTNKAPRQRIPLPVTDDALNVRTPGQRERDNIAYDKLAETAKFPVANGFVSFTRRFRYLGTPINYSLCNDDDITARILLATASMGALKEKWCNPHLDIYNKYITIAKQPCYGLLKIKPSYKIVLYYVLMQFVYYGGPLPAMNAVLAIIADGGRAIIVINREAVQINYFLL
jgi:hypothetical protein